jgi:hypothetical protein
VLDQGIVADLKTLAGAEQQEAEAHRDDPSCGAGRLFSILTSGAA